MTNRYTPFLYAAVLFAGATFGALIGTTGVMTAEPAHAQRAPQPVVGEPVTASQNLSSLMQGSEHLAEIARQITPSVVHIQSTHTADSRVVEETGSGVIITSRAASGKFVVTNNHVIDGARAKDIDIHVYDGRLLHPQQIWTDPESDLAVLKISNSNLPAATWGDSDSVEMGHFVLAVGSPFGLSRSMTIGIISAKGRRSLRLGNGRRRVLNQDFLQTDAAINPGNSGGPLLDLNGHVVGINTAIASNSGGNDGIGFSIPSNLVRRVIDQLLSTGRVRRAYLGVKLDADFKETTARRLRLDRVRGARVIEVYSETPAAQAGLRKDDVIVRFDDVLVQDENHLINLVSLTPIGSTAKLMVIRNGQKQVIEVKLADRTELIRRSVSTDR